jgi:2-dehydro-3-deoxyphosphooctonate aldolase (KDO 8-P synthase)
LLRREAPFFLIAGPCVIESPRHPLKIARRLKQITGELGVPFVFKASFDKANRSSLGSYRGPGIERGLAILAEVREELGVPILTDVHEVAQVEAAARVADVLQIPAFLCRQTDLVVAAAKSGRVVNIKKGQFMAPEDLARAVDKVRQAGSEEILVTERGVSFGYHNLVVDMRSFPILARTGCPVVYDATHSLQLPAIGEETGGQREFAVPLARAAVAAGAHAVFFETHPDPDAARSDAATQLPLAAVPGFIRELLTVWNALHPVGG